MKNFFLINGILDFSNSIKGWNDEGADYINSHATELCYHARSYQYAAMPIFHNLLKKGRVDNFLELISRYSNGENNVVAHSDGVDVTCKSLQREGVKFSDIHLFAGACEADFKKNGLNEAVARFKVKRIFVYGSPNDKALIKAKNNDWWLRAIGQQYGNPPLGLSGPLNMSSEAAAVTKISMIPSYGHSTWFQPKMNLIDSMLKVINA